jgi:hypothetical protein
MGVVFAVTTPAILSQHYTYVKRPASNFYRVIESCRSPRRNVRNMTLWTQKQLMLHAGSLEQILEYKARH